MELLKAFINEYGAALLYAAITAIAGYMGLAVKRLYEKHVNDKAKRDVARTVVQAVEQVYKSLHGAEKLNQALVSASEMLAEKGIKVTELELRMLIESAVSEFNNAFNKREGKDDTENTEKIKTEPATEEVKVAQIVPEPQSTEKSNEQSLLNPQHSPDNINI